MRLQRMVLDCNHDEMPAAACTLPPGLPSPGIEAREGLGTRLQRMVLGCKHDEILAAAYTWNIDLLLFSHERWKLLCMTSFS